MASAAETKLTGTLKQSHLTTWPGLTEYDAFETDTCNGDREDIKITSDLEDTSVTPACNGDRTHLVYAVVIDKGQLYNDLTERIPQRSRKGNWYLMVVYPFDCKYINPVAMK
jgi:hypothetical protein